jgi:hypothetical protein
VPVGIDKRATGRSGPKTVAVELQMVHELGDPGSTTGDHRVGATRVTSHGDRVVDRRPDAGAGCHHWYTKGVGRSMKPRRHMARMRAPRPRVARAGDAGPRLVHVETPVPHGMRQQSLGYLQ